jgi:small subunit ribosomal protein S20
MPKIKSAKKALRQNIRRREKNDSRKLMLKKAVKEFKKLIAAKKSGEAQAALKKVYEVADKIAKTKYIKKNKAARIKSRATKMLSKALAK